MLGKVHLSICCRIGCVTWGFVTRDDIVTRWPAVGTSVTMFIELPHRLALKKL